MVGDILPQHRKNLAGGRRFGDSADDGRQDPLSEKRVPRSDLLRRARCQPLVRLIAAGFDNQYSQHVAEGVQVEASCQFHRRRVAPCHQTAQLVIDHFGQQRLRLGLLEHFEPRVEARLDGMGSQQRRTE